MSESYEDADSQLALFGTELADAVIEAVPGWIEGCIRLRLGEWKRSSGSVSIEDDEITTLISEAGRSAVSVVSKPLRDLVSADVDVQRNTPLGLVRPLVDFATGVLEQLGVPPVERDDFESSRFPEDVYRLTPVSLAALGDEVGNLALAWGAAKAMAHRKRHT